jgi:dTMP kinase
MNEQTRGRFITLEGGEAVGKSTQVRALGAALETRGITVVTTREPGGSPGAEAIRTLLLHGSAEAWGPRAEALLFAAARSDHVERLILPALAAGRWVLCDRFIDSSRAYQGGASDLADDDILALHRVGSSGLMPDRTLLLAVDSAATAQRRNLRQLELPDRFEDRPDDFHDRVGRAFAVIAAADPQRVRTVDASGTPEQVTQRLLAELADLLR